MKYFNTDCPLVSRDCVDGFGALTRCKSCKHNPDNRNPVSDTADRPVNTSDDYVPIPADVFHYYEKAKRLGRDTVAYSILHGELSVQEIEKDDRFAWLAD